MHKHKIWQHCLAVFFIVASYLALLWVGVNIMVAYAYESSMCPLFVCTFAEIFPHFKTLRESALKGTIRYATPFKTLRTALFVIKTSGPKQSKTFRSSEKESDLHSLHSKTKSVTSYRRGHTLSTQAGLGGGRVSKMHAKSWRGGGVLALRCT